MAPLRIGILGANVHQGWAFRAHVPAIEALRNSGHADLAITAVATSRASSAAEAAQHTGAEPFTSPEALAASPEVDLVVVTVKVPAHRELVTAAIAAGKAVLCEWPLGLDLAEATALRAGNTTHPGFVGFQARQDPAALALREAITAGEIGDIQSVTVESARAKFRGDIPEQFVYTLERASGAGAREVHTGHVLGLLDWVTGGIEVTGGTTAVHRSEYRVAGRDEPFTASAPDTVTALFTVGHGLGTAAIWDGEGEAGTVIRIQGTKGRALLQSKPVDVPLSQQVQMAPLRAEIQLVGHDAPNPLPTSDPLIDVPLTVESRNIAAQYLAIDADLRDGGHRAATFDDAVRVHQWIEMLQER